MGHAKKGCSYAVLLDIQWNNDTAVPSAEVSDLLKK